MFGLFKRPHQEASAENSAKVRPERGVSAKRQTQRVRRSHENWLPEQGSSPPRRELRRSLPSLSSHDHTPPVCARPTPLKRVSTCDCVTLRADRKIGAADLCPSVYTHNMNEHLPPRPLHGSNQAQAAARAIWTPTLTLDIGLVQRCERRR